MNFAWTREQDELYQRILCFSQDKLATQDRESAQIWTRAQWRLCGEIGLLGLCVSTAYGGSGLDAVTTARAVEAFGASYEDMGLVFSAAAHLFACCMPIFEHGSDAMKATWLPGLCSGELIGANAITERDAGSDILALKTRAVRDGDAYVMTGQKSYVSNGPVADLFVVYAATNPAHGYLGLTAFIVEREAPGLVTGEPFNKMGLTSTPACQLSLNECRVSAANIIGREGQGSLIFKRSMQWERACLFASYLGQMERQLEQTVRYAQNRRQFGSAIGKKQAIAHRLADMKLRLEAARLLLYRACWLFDQNHDSLLAISLSKLAVSEAAIQGGLDAIRIHGSVGFDCEEGIERMLRDAVPGTIFSGTSEMQRDIIASELGL
jgi:alkylation response protein AidB-like acyl-CoA dehydrogenase